MKTFIFVLLTLCIFNIGNAFFCPPTSLLYRTIDGKCNNLLNKNWGSSLTYYHVGPESLEPYPWQNIPQLDPLPTYAEIDTLPSPGPRGNSRDISNALCFRNATQEADIDTENHSMFSVMFGQFLNHDLEMNQMVNASTRDFFPLVSYVTDPNDTPCLAASESDPYRCNPDDEILVSEARNSGGTFYPDGSFKTFNNASSFLDLDTVYGRTQEDSDKIRSHNRGKILLVRNAASIPIYPGAPIKMYAEFENLLPSYDVSGLAINPNFIFGGNVSTTFTAGDPRINENIALIFFHTLFAREHNKVCDELIEGNILWKLFPQIFDEIIYQKARSIVIAKYQHIVYEQFLPSLLGTFGPSLGTYTSYNPFVNPSTGLAFSGASFRYGHFTLKSYSAINQCGLAMASARPAADPNTKILSAGMTNPVPEFLSPMGVLVTTGGFENIVRGLINERSAPNTLPVESSIRDLRLPFPVKGVVDLITLDLGRMRYNQLPNYIKVRSAYHGLDATTNKIYGLPGCPANLENNPSVEDPIECYNYITSDLETATKLREVYTKINLIDPIIGVTAEDKLPGSSFSRTGGNLIIEQFKRTRDGDRFFYRGNLNAFIHNERQTILETTMGKLLRRNLNMNELDAPENPFVTPENYRNELVESCQ